MIHVYGIVDELRTLPAVVGLDGAPLERRRIGRLELVISSSEGPPSPEVSREAVLRHAEVLDALLRNSDAVLPVQLGRGFPDEGALAAAIREREDDLLRGLERVRGCVELGLRVIDHEAGSEAPSEGSGTDYMRSRLAEVQRSDRLVVEFHEPLARLARACAVTRGEGLRAAYLVPASEAAAFRKAAEHLAADRPELTVVTTGPWPPYSFTGAQEEAA